MVDLFLPEKIEKDGDLSLTESRFRHWQIDCVNSAMLIDRFLTWIPNDLPDSKVILDVGIYTGEQACEFATMFPESRIFAFEARPSSSQEVRRNVAKYPKIEVVEAAVMNSTGKRSFM